MQPATSLSNLTPNAASRMLNRTLLISGVITTIIYLIFTQDFDGQSSKFDSVISSLRSPWKNPYDEVPQQEATQQEAPQQASSTANYTFHNFPQLNHTEVPNGTLNGTFCTPSPDVCNCECPDYDFTPEPPINEPAYGMVSMIYGNVPKIYDRAIETHNRHALHHNYAIDILKRPIAQGYWSKTYYMIGLLVAQLAGPESDRRKWLMWFDADTIIVNENIPVDIFLPSDDKFFNDIMFVFARDDVGLNSGVFFARVHETTLHILMRAYAYRIVNEGKNLGHAYDQVCLEQTIANATYRKHALWTPRHWFNARERLVRPGAFLGHFFDDPHKEADMLAVVTKAENRHPEALIPYDQTFYPAELEEFWRLNRECRQAIELSKMFHIPDGEEKDRYDQQRAELENTCTWHTDDIPRVRERLDEMKHVLYPLWAKEQQREGKAPP